jgi:branched-chain amino acid transport system ATP-binding protein
MPRKNTVADTILLEAKGIVKVFGGVRAVDDVSIAVREGTIHALIGPNGAGKTTFFNAVSGFAFPESGRVTFKGQDVTRALNWKRIVMGMGRTFQTPSVFPELTVDENVRLGVRAHAKQAFRLRTPRGSAAEAVDARVDELLGFVNLFAQRDRQVSELAHGSQRLVEIAMSLSTDPVLVLLDEPMAGLAARPRQDAGRRDAGADRRRRSGAQRVPRQGSARSCLSFLPSMACARTTARSASCATSR